MVSDLKTVPALDLSRDDAKHATGTDAVHLQEHLLNQLRESLWYPKGLSEDQAIARFRAAMEALRAIKPEDGLEGMLAVQMVATHAATMECLRRAMIPGQTPAGREMNLRHAKQLMATYLRQLEVLDKHRGKGTQKVTVEYVNVQAGGQAIVGSVERAGPAAPGHDGNASPPVIEHQPVQGLAIGQTCSERRPRRKKVGR